MPQTISFMVSCDMKSETWHVFSIFKDYPSIAHLVQKLSDNNIQTIFAVTEEFQPIYQVSFLNLVFFFLHLFLQWNQRFSVKYWQYFLHLLLRIYWIAGQFTMSQQSFNNILPNSFHYTTFTLNAKLATQR